MGGLIRKNRKMIFGPGYVSAFTMYKTIFDEETVALFDEHADTCALLGETLLTSAPAEHVAPRMVAEAGRCVAVNGKRMTPLQVITEANAIGGRNGLGVSHALENRIIGTKSRGAASPARAPR